jgi:arabinose-5-phosphate isomerase
MLKTLFEEQQKHINEFFENIDLPLADKVLEMMMTCQGVIFFSGIGKSGLVAKKIAVTITSTGTRALYMSPTNALHGDIGMVSPQDLFIFLSRSGESDELLTLLPFLRNKGVSIISIVCKKNSRLARASDLSLVLPMNRELCPFDSVPTTSAAIQLIFGDVLAIAMMRLKNVQHEQYTKNHPAGRIGKRLTLKVKDLMLTGSHVPLCKPTDKLGEVLVELSTKRCGCLLITNPTNHLMGIFTDGDLGRSLNKLGPAALERQIDELMTKTPKSIGADSLIVHAIQLMEADQKNAITVLPVLDDQKQVVGLVKMHDIIQSGIS